MVKISDQMNKQTNRQRQMR